MSKRDQWVAVEGEKQRRTLRAREEKDEGGRSSVQEDE